MKRQSANLFENCPFEETSKLKQEIKIAKTNDVVGVNQEGMIDVSDQLDDLLNGLSYFGVQYKYAQDMYSETTLTIHQEKAKCKKAFNDNTFIQKATNQLLNVVFGDKPHIQSSNGVILGYSKRWNNFTGYMGEMKAGCKQAVATGDGYVKKIRGDKGSFKYKNIENSEDMYIEWDFEENRPIRYIERVYYTQANAEGIKNPEYKTFTLKTPLGTETINGIEHSPNEIIHLKFGENVWGIYGRGACACALDDIDILNQMERSAAIIVKYKAVPKKLLFPDSNKDDEVMSDKELEPVKTMLKQMKDYESPMVGTKFSSLNLTDGGQQMDLTPYFDYFKRKISIVLSPEFIVHGELVNRSTSVEQKQLFYLDVCAIRSDFEPIIQSSTDEGMNASLKVIEDQGVIVPKASFFFEWGEYDVELRVEKTERIQKEWLDGTIRLGQYQELMGYPIDEEVANLYSWEVRSSPSEQVGEALKKAIGEKE